ncbi:hypothetical protein [Sedimenticola sp.]|uniref:hypothetical protein n=1 Tax=Sedimenticola sp. TaxID=1940285 RepID=UPI003D14C2C9
MKNTIKAITVLTLIASMASSFADGPGWTLESNVKNLVVVATGGINVQLSPGLSGCTSQSGYGETYASIYPDHPGLNAMHSNLLAAKMSGKKVKLYLFDNKCKAVEMILID